jgi:hypothetical protein
MNPKIAILPMLFVLAAALGAGCTVTQGPPPSPTPAATVTQTATVPAATTAATGSCIEPGPTVTVPAQFEVAVDVIRNPVTLYKQITVTYQGGAGQYLTQRVDATITRDDCSTETKSITRPESGTIAKGTSVTFNGSDRDRIQVTVTINGVAYEIYDRVLAQQSRR